MATRRPSSQYTRRHEPPTVSNDEDVPERVKRLPTTPLGAVLLRVTDAYPVDGVAGQDARKRDARRRALLAENPVEAKPYVENLDPDPDEVLAQKEHEAALRAGIAWLAAHFENDLPVKLIIAASAFEDVKFKSSLDLASACGLTEKQVQSAKERMKYAVKKVGAPTFQAFLDHVTQES